MATQAYIIHAESKLIDGSATGAECAEIRENYEWECRAEGTGRHYPENHDVWGTLRLNAIALNRRVTENGAYRAELASLIATLDRNYA